VPQQDNVGAEEMAGGVVNWNQLLEASFPNRHSSADASNSSAFPAPGRNPQMAVNSGNQAKAIAAIKMFSEPIGK
jgi:hypothetical protein